MPTVDPGSGHLSCGVASTLVAVTLKVAVIELSGFTAAVVPTPGPEIGLDWPQV